MRTVVFDLDGTLADTSGDLIAAANACFQDMGEGDVLHPERDAETAFHGGRAMLTLGLSRVRAGATVTEREALVERYYPRLLEAYHAEIDRHTTLYPGAMAAVEALKSADCAVSICTNKPEGLARKLLTRLNILHEFAALIGADTLPTRKPDPAPYLAAVEQVGGSLARSLLVGDTNTDRETARAAGVPCVLVTFGPAGERVRDLAPEAVIGHFDELPARVVELLGV